MLGVLPSCDALLIVAFNQSSSNGLKNVVLPLALDCVATLPAPNLKSFPVPLKGKPVIVNVPSGSYTISLLGSDGSNVHLTSRIESNCNESANVKKSPVIGFTNTLPLTRF